MITWLVIIFCYLLGSIPTAYVAGRIVKGKDIRELGDRNMGAQNAFRELSPTAGMVVGIVDVSKGVLAILIARALGLTLPATLTAGAATVIGHNWPVFVGFRGGRGESTTIGILLVMVTMPMLIAGGPAAIVLLLKKNVILASAVLFIALPLVGWWLRVPPLLIFYGIALPILVALTHLLRVRRATVRHADIN